MPLSGLSKAVLCRWQNLFMREGMDGLLRDKTRPQPAPEAMDAETPGKKRGPYIRSASPSFASLDDLPDREQGSRQDNNQGNKYKHERCFCGPFRCVPFREPSRPG
jgi:hypothetical protein